MSLFNLNQLATWKEAGDLKEQMDAYRISHGLYMAGGILPVMEKNDISGIYIPDWVAGPGGFVEPFDQSDENNKKYFLHYRFASGRSGVNVGLILDKAKRYGGNWDYVFYYLNSGDLSS